jgi:hypothetical protein
VQSVVELINTGSVMFSLFKKKPKTPSIQDAAQQVVDQLRSEFSDQVLSTSFAINERVDRLRSVKIGFFDELMGVTDDVADRVFPLFEGFPDLKILEVHGFCASTVAVATHVSELPKDEKPAIINIYLDLWIACIIGQDANLNGPKLKVSITAMWQSYAGYMMRAATPEEAAKIGFPDAPLTLAQELDRICGVSRSAADLPTAGAVLNEAVMHAMTAVENIGYGKAHQNIRHS